MMPRDRHHVWPILSPAVIIFPACAGGRADNNPADRRQASKLDSPSDNSTSICPGSVPGVIGFLYCLK